MQEHPRSKRDLYISFLGFISKEIQHERSKVNRRMFSVFLWSFILPAITAITLLTLVKMGLLPRTSKNYLEWVILVFPVAYSLYLLGAEVLIQVPSTFKKSGVATVLKQAADESQWRERISEELVKQLGGSPDDWDWINLNFKMDLDKLIYRARYLTALAGAVFYLVLQGIDLIGEDTPAVTWMKSPVGWVEVTQNNYPQFIGLGLFLILFYLSGSQTYHMLSRYLSCAALIQHSKKRQA